MVAQQLKTTPDQLDLTTSLDGFSFDKDAATAFASALTERFNVPFSDAGGALSEATTVGELVEYAMTQGEGVENLNPGFGWQKDQAYTLYGVYTFMVYLTSIFGGMVADRFLGTHRSMIFGGWIIALGHIVLAMMALFPYALGTVSAKRTVTGR